jgi:hypothetical protein
MLTHNLWFRIGLWFCFPLTAILAGEAAPPAQPPVVIPEAEWQKHETKAVPLPLPRQVLSPGIFDAELFNVLTFGKDGAPVDSGLPHFGKDKAGKDYPAIMVRFLQGSFWFDFNGDGKPGKDETRVLNTDGMTDPLTCELHYEDGTAAQYMFRMKTVVEKEKFAIIRAIARTFDFEGKKVILLDDNGNGKYGDIDKDSVIVGDSPVSFLGKHLNIGDKFYEILVHDAGATLEMRAAPKLDFGWVVLV